MSRKFTFSVVVALAILFVTAALTVLAQSSSPNAYDVIAAVNALRAGRGLPALQADGSLMAAAQAHADYMATNSYITHSGPGGTSPQDRAIAAGYGGGASVVVTENIAVAQVATAIDTIIFSIWGDSVHMNTMLNSSYTHIGVGVAEAGGQAYYALSAGNISGQAQPAANNTAAATRAPGAAVETESTAPQMFAVQTATPQPDGSIVHEVQPGQAPWSIATAYGITIADMAAMNGLNPDNLILFPGQTLIIQVAPTPTISPTITETSVPPTRTPQPTATERPPTRTPTITVTVTPTVKPILPEVGFLQTLDRRTIGIGIIVVCGFGLLLVMASSMRRK